MLLPFHIWAATWQNQQNECAPSEDSDQPGHLPSLIRDFAVCMKKAWVLSYPLSAQRRSDQTGRMPRLIWVFAGRTLILLVLSCRGSFSSYCFRFLNFIKWKCNLWNTLYFVLVLGRWFMYLSFSRGMGCGDRIALGNKKMLKTLGLIPYPLVTILCLKSPWWTF